MYLFLKQSELDNSTSSRLMRALIKHELFDCRLRIVIKESI